ncbi:MAG TPA: sugar-binding protein [Saprospiraceae bacterium]|nr:sugar-binding protein [Saprospiraceae bacterium]
MKTYEVKPCANAPEKHLRLAAWEPAYLLTDFSYPWRAEVPPKTEFRALHNDTYLYFRFEVWDDQLIAAEHEQVKQAVVESDRVELFFRKDKQMNPYYCLEMDWKGRLLDNQAQYHRIMDYQWQWPANGLTFQSRLTAKGYTVEGSLTKTSLRQLGLLREGKIETGIFRGEYQDSPGKQVKWISWVRPDSPQADFHIPSAFGLLKFI